MFRQSYNFIFSVMLCATSLMNASTLVPAQSDASEKSRTAFFLSELEVARKSDSQVSQLAAYQRISPLLRGGLHQSAKDDFFKALQVAWEQRQPSREFDLVFYDVVSTFAFFHASYEQKAKITPWIARLHKDMERYALHSGDCVNIAYASRPAFFIAAMEKGEKYQAQLATLKTGEEKLSGLFILIAPKKNKGDVIAAGDEVLLQPLFYQAHDDALFPFASAMSFVMHGNTVSIVPYSKEEKRYWKIEHGGYSSLNKLPYLLPGQLVAFKEHSFYVAFDFVKKMNFALRAGPHPLPEDAFVMRVCSQKTKSELENTLIAQKVDRLDTQSDEKVIQEISNIMRLINENTVLASKTKLVKKVIALMERAHTAKVHVRRLLRYVSFQIAASPFFSFHTSMIQTGLKRMNASLQGDALKNNGYVTLRKGKKYLAVVPAAKTSSTICWIDAHDKRLKDRVHFFKVQHVTSKKILSFGDEVNLFSYYGGVNNSPFSLPLMLCPPALGKPLAHKIVIASGDVVVLATYEADALSVLLLDEEGKPSRRSLSKDAYCAPRQTHIIIESV